MAKYRIVENITHVQKEDGSREHFWYLEHKGFFGWHKVRTDVCGEKTDIHFNSFDETESYLFTKFGYYHSIEKKGDTYVLHRFSHGI